MDEFEKMISEIINSASNCMEEYDDMKRKNTGNDHEVMEQLKRCNDYLELAKEEADMQ